MASDLNFVEYVRDQINGAGEVSFKKMFGEYAIYYDNKVVALVCDNFIVRKANDLRAIAHRTGCRSTSISWCQAIFSDRRTA
jgi:TfoX/Sxy family transcriptional regulator of competence genes